jgi:CATRA-associated small protein
MNSPGGRADGWDPGDVLDARAQALDVVQAALGWHLTGARWQAVDQALTAMAEALETGDLDALVAATAELELDGPVRLTPITAALVTRPASPIRDRLNRLVYSLGGTVLPDTDAAGMDDDDRSGN